MLHRPLGFTAWKLVAAPDYLDRHLWPETPADLSQLEQVRFTTPDHVNTLHFTNQAARIAVPLALTAGNGEAVRQLVLGGLGIARFSDFMVAEDIAAGRLVELLPGQLEAEPLEISALYLTRISGLGRLGVFLDGLGTLLR